MPHKSRPSLAASSTPKRTLWLVQLRVCEERPLCSCTSQHRVCAEWRGLCAGAVCKHKE